MKPIFTAAALPFAVALTLLLVGCENLFQEEEEDNGGSPTESDVVVDDDYGFQSDPTDSLPFFIADTVPNDGAAGVFPQSGVTIYFDDIVDPNTLSDVSLSVEAGGNQIYGTMTLSKSANGQNAIVSFSPFGTFPENETVEVILTTTDGLLDKGGNPLSSQVEIIFQTGESIDGDAGNLGFESGLSGWQIVGNGGVVSLPYAGLSLSGNQAVAISTGSITDDNMSGSAVDGQYSALISGALDKPGGAAQLRFDYYFISAEFNEFIGSQYDDNVAVQVTGPNGSNSSIVESVNSYTSADTTAASVGWDGDAYHTGVQTAAIDLDGLGGELTITVVISDIEDTAFSSMVVLDNVRFD